MDKAAIEKRVFNKIAWKLLPILTAAYVFNYLDRSNIGFAGLTMNRDLGLTATEFGYGAGILFIGYCLLEIPSNIALYRVGARRWLSRIMITWGLVSVGLIFVHGTTSFYILRFLLGVAEAGFFPGVTFYLAGWFPAEYRARILAWFLVAIPVSSVIGGPLSGMLLGFDGLAGLAGWKWLFLIEGLPALIIGFVLLRVLVDHPRDASWLTADEQRIVTERLAEERRDRAVKALGPALMDTRVLLCAGVMLCFTIGSYGIGIWLPLILKQAVTSNMTIGWLAAIPYVFASIGMIVWARVVDRGDHKIVNLAVACLVAGIGFVLALGTSSVALSLAGLTVALVGVTSARAIFWAVPTRFLTGVAAAGGLAFINTVGTTGGFFGPSIVGWLKDATGSFTAGLSAMAAFLFMGALFALALKRFIHEAQ